MDNILIKNYTGPVGMAAEACESSFGCCMALFDLWNKLVIFVLAEEERRRSTRRENAYIYCFPNTKTILTRLLSGGSSGSMLLSGGVSGSMLLSGGVSGSMLLSGGVSGSMLLSGGVSGSMLLSGGSSGSMLLSGGVSGSMLLSGGVSGSVLLSGGSSGSMLLSGGVSGSMLLSGGVSGSMLLSGGSSGSVQHLVLASCVDPCFPRLLPEKVYKLNSIVRIAEKNHYQQNQSNFKSLSKKLIKQITDKIRRLPHLRR